jgi:xanthine dehydrogenase accessory factor
MKNIYIRLLELLRKGEHLALATIIQTKGSTPQVPGASALFSAEGRLEGTLGGGLLEFEAEKKTLQSIRENTSRLSDFFLKEDISSEEGAICGGEAKILIDASPEKHLSSFQELNQSLFQRQPGVLATFIDMISAEKISLLREWIEKKDKRQTALKSPSSSFQEEIKKASSKGTPSLLKTRTKRARGKAKESWLFLEPIFPLPQLVIAGAGHIGQALTHLGSFLNFEITVIDDRPEYANKEMLPEADHIIVEEIGKAVQNFPVSADTYLVIVTRGHRHDGEALRRCIASQAAYIGMIGSRRKINLIRKKFLEKGWATPIQFDRVHAPIGLDIESKTVEEIAISIAAQLILVRSQSQEKTRQGD